MNWWFFSWLFINIYTMGFVMAKHGEARPNYNGWVMLIAIMIELTVIVMMIRHGGF